MARSLSDLKLPEINFLLREAGWLPHVAPVKSNGDGCQRSTSPWAEVQLGMMEIAGLPRRAKSQALQLDQGTNGGIPKISKDHGHEMPSWLVVWNMSLWFCILGIVHPTDKYFSEGWLHHQPASGFQHHQMTSPSWQGSSWHSSKQLHPSLAGW